MPVYFDPSVQAETVRQILSSLIEDQNVFLDPSRVVFVVDRNTIAESVLDTLTAGPRVPSNIVHLERNQGKMGAVREGLRRLLEEPVRYLVTRDCDGDHRLEDLSRMVQVAEEMRRTIPGVALSVFGARPSLTRPMEWVRKEWETLTNRVFESLADWLLAGRGRVLDRRFWNGYPLDLQSGYRLYDRSGAELALRSMERLPDHRTTYLMACEMVPFLEISLEGGRIGQVQRTTSVVQPISSFQGIDFAACYAELLVFLGKVYGIDPDLLLQLFDNHMLASEIYFSGERQQVLDCRELLGGQSTPVRHPSVM